MSRILNPLTKRLVKDTWSNRRKIALLLIDEVRNFGYSRKLRNVNLDRPMNDYIEQLLRRTPDWRTTFDLTKRRLVNVRNIGRIPPIRTIFNTGESVIQRSIVRRRHTNFMDNPENTVTSSTPSYSINTTQLKLSPLSPILYNNMNQLDITDAHMTLEFQMLHLRKYALPKLREILTAGLINGPQKVHFTADLFVHGAGEWSLINEGTTFMEIARMPKLPTTENEFSGYYNQENIRQAIDENMYDPKHIILTRVKAFQLNDLGDVETCLARFALHIYNFLESWLEKGYVAFVSLMNITTFMTSNNPLGSAWCDLPKELQAKGALLNPQNKRDNRCFEYCIGMALQLIDNPNVKIRPERFKIYALESSLIPEGQQDGNTKMSDIKKWERTTKLNINAYYYDEKKVVPLLMSKSNFERSVDLLLIDQHWLLIKTFDRLLSSNGRRSYHCKQCMRGFSTKGILEKHTVDCSQDFDACLEQCPKPGSKLEFKPAQLSQIESPIIIYYDFESQLNKLEKPEKQQTSENPNKKQKQSYTHKTQEHVAMSWKLLIKTKEGIDLPPNLTPYHSYTGEDAIQQFIKTLLEIQQIINDKIFYNKEEKEMIFTEEDEAAYNASNRCFLCNDTFEEECKGCEKVKDHCKITGEFRGAAHTKCSKKIKEARNFSNIPIIAHNTMGYDMHLILQEAMAEERIKSERMSCISCNSQKFKTVSIGQYKFLDSVAFLNKSLGTLMQALPDDEKHELRKICENDDQFQATKCKQYYPYEYMNDDAHIKLDLAIPTDKDLWHSTLTGEGLTDDDMRKIEQAKTTLNLKTMRQWHDFYLSIDVAGLADVFESFRRISMTQWKLEPCQFLGLPGLSFQGLLRQRLFSGKAPIDLLSDVDMYRFFEKSIRGGVCHVGKRSHTSNHPSLPNFDKTQPISQSLDLDANNLYGDSMSQKLPARNFSWLDMDSDMISEILEDILEKSEDYWKDSDIGYTLEIDLEYPKELHDDHNDFPLAPEKLTCSEAELSEYSRKLITDEGGRINMPKCEKLVCHLNKREKYTVNIRTLALYRRLGMKVTKIHRGIVYEQEAWMKQWIDGNTQLRALATSEHEKDLYKLANNACFGKTMQSVRGYSDTRLTCNPTDFAKLVKKSTFHSHTEIGKQNDNDNKLHAIEMVRNKVSLDKCIFAGSTILDLSKTHMYASYYDSIKPMFEKGGGSVKLGGTDTDSFMISITQGKGGASVDEIMWENRDFFDLSNYPKNHPLYDESNKKVVGKFKNECAGQIIADRVNLRAKLYAFRIYDPEKKEYTSDMKRCKGVKRSVVQKTIHFDDYKNCLNNQRDVYATQVQLRSYNHNIYTIESRKKAMSAYDDKRYILPNGIDTRAHGHWRNQTN